MVWDSVPVTEAAGPPEFPPINVPVKSGVCQVYWVPAGTIPSVTFMADKLNVTPLQTTREKVLMSTFGFTQTVTENKLPVQSPEIGVTK